MRKNETLTFNGISLSDYQCFYDGSQLWRKPEKMVDYYAVPGKNGDVQVSQNKYSNITRPFECHIRKDWNKNYNSLINELSAVNGYARFETTEEPEVFMMASFESEIEPSMWQFNERGTFTLNFNFKPQKWLKMGENAIEITNTKSLLNPTNFDAFPLIELVGTGSITINSSVLTLSANTSTTFIDCEIQDAYEGTINRNGDLTIVGGFPVLTQENTITVSGFTSCKIYPRWWRL